MAEIARMFAVLLALVGLSGGLIATVKGGTEEEIENQVLTYVKGPALAQIFPKATNDPVADRFAVDGVTLFPAAHGYDPKAVAFEGFGQGYGGGIGVMVGIDLDTGALAGVAVTTHSETPGLGALAQTDPQFVSQFAGLPCDEPFRLLSDGGQIDGITGASVTSRAVSAVVTEACGSFAVFQPQVRAALEEFVPGGEND